jgi:serine/threonine-protein kinase
MTTIQLKQGAFVTPTVRLVRPLAEGGMGQIWIAEHLGLHAQVVVKLMAKEMAARADGAERFAREAAVAAAIKSPHVVQVFDHGET